MDDVSQSAGASGQLLPETGETPPSATSIEAKGIEHITPGERWGLPAGLFWLWAGGVGDVEDVVYGRLLVVLFGLRFAQSALCTPLFTLFSPLTRFPRLPRPPPLPPTS